MATTTMTLSMVMKYGYDNVTDEAPINETLSRGDYSEERLFQAVYLGYLWTALIIGLPGNVFIAIVYIVVKQKRTSDWFIFFLSVYDCAVCVFAVPLYLSIETGTWMKTGSDLACKIEQFTIFTAQFSSVSVLGIIAVDRYLKICHPTKRSLTAIQARNLGMCTPLVSAVVAAPILVWDGNVERRFCRVQEEYRRTLGVKFHLCLTFSFFICMFLVVIFCYSHVCFVVRQRMQRHRENALKRKHLMQIPAFLQAISNVDDLNGLSTNQNNRNKKRFSLFSIGSSRRLSAISPWIKARLSLPNDNSGRKLALPRDEMELTTKDSLADIKRQLDQALMFRAKSSMTEEFPSDKNAAFNSESDVCNYIKTKIQNKQTTKGAQKSNHRTHADVNDDDMIYDNKTKYTKEKSINSYHVIPDNESRPNEQENIKVAQHSSLQTQTSPVFCFDYNDSQNIETPLQSINSYKSSLENRSRTNHEENVIVVQHSEHQIPKSLVFCFNCNDSQKLDTVHQSDNEKMGGTANVVLANSAECFSCQKSCCNPQGFQKHNGIFHSSKGSKVSYTSNPLMGTSFHICSTENFKERSEFNTHKTIKTIPRNIQRDCITCGNMKTSTQCVQVLGKVHNDEGIRFSTKEFGSDSNHHDRIPSPRSYQNANLTYSKCEHKHAQNECEKCDLNVIENVDSESSKICETNKYPEKGHQRYSMCSLFTRRKKPSHKLKMLKYVGLGAKCKTSSCLLSLQHGSNRSESEVIRHSQEKSYSDSNLYVLSETSNHKPKDITNSNCGILSAADHDNSFRCCCTHRQNTQSQSYRQRTNLHNISRTARNPLYFDYNKLTRNCVKCGGKQLRHSRSIDCEDIQIKSSTRDLRNIQRQSRIRPEKYEEEFDKKLTHFHKKRHLSFLTGDQDDDDNDDATSVLPSESKTRRWRSLQNVSKNCLSKLTNIHSRSTGSISWKCTLTEKHQTEPGDKAMVNSTNLKAKLENTINKFHLKDAPISSNVLVRSFNNSESNLGIDSPFLIPSATRNVQFQYRNEHRLADYNFTRNPGRIPPSILNLSVNKSTVCDCQLNTQQVDRTALYDFSLEQDHQGLQSCNKSIKPESTIYVQSVVNGEKKGKTKTPNCHLNCETLQKIDNKTDLIKNEVKNSEVRQSERQKSLSTICHTCLDPALPETRKSVPSLKENKNNYAFRTSHTCSQSDRPFVTNSVCCCTRCYTGIDKPCTKNECLDFEVSQIKKSCPCTNKCTHNATMTGKTHSDFTNSCDNTRTYGEVFCSKNMFNSTGVQMDGNPVIDFLARGGNCNNTNAIVHCGTHYLTDCEKAAISERIREARSESMKFETNRCSSLGCECQSTHQLEPAFEHCKEVHVERKREQEWGCCGSCNCSFEQTYIDRKQNMTDEYIIKSSSCNLNDLINRHETSGIPLNTLPHAPLKNYSSEEPYEDVTTTNSKRFHSLSPCPRHEISSMNFVCSECDSLTTSNVNKNNAASDKQTTNITNCSSPSIDHQFISTSLLGDSHEVSNHNRLLEFRKKSQNYCNDNTDLLTHEMSKCSICWNKQRQKSNITLTSPHKYIKCQNSGSTERQVHVPLDVSSRALYSDDDALRKAATNSKNILPGKSHASDNSRSCVQCSEYFQSNKNQSLAMEHGKQDVCEVKLPVSYFDFFRCNECFLTNFKLSLPDQIIAILKHMSEVTIKTNLADSMTRAAGFSRVPVIYRRSINHELSELFNQYVLHRTTTFIFSPSLHFASKLAPSFFTSSLIWDISNQSNLYDNYKSHLFSHFFFASVCPVCYSSSNFVRNDRQKPDGCAANAEIVEAAECLEPMETELFRVKYLIDTPFTCESWPDFCALSTSTDCMRNYYSLSGLFCKCMNNSFINEDFSCPFWSNSMYFLNLSKIFKSCTCSSLLFQSNMTDHEKWPSGIESNSSRQKSMSEAKLPDVVYGACADNDWNEVVCGRNIEIIPRKHDNSPIDFEINKFWNHAPCSQPAERETNPGLLGNIYETDLEACGRYLETLKISNNLYSKDTCKEDHSISYMCKCMEMKNSCLTSDIVQRGISFGSVIQDSHSKNKINNLQNPRPNADLYNEKTLCTIACSGAVGGNFDYDAFVRDENRGVFESQCTMGYHSETLNLPQNKNMEPTTNGDESVSSGTFNFGQDVFDTQFPDTTEHNCLEQPMLTSTSYVLRPNDKLRQFKLASRNIVNHALHSLVPLAVGSNKSHTERANNELAAFSPEAQFATTDLNKSSPTMDSYVDIINPCPNGEISEYINTSTENNSLNVNVIDTTRGIHSFLRGCVPTFKVDDADTKSSLNDETIPKSDTCEFFVQTVFDTFFTRNTHSFKSDPCLNATDIDYSNSELMDFPLSPLLNPNPEDGEDKTEKHNDPSVFHIAGSSSKNSTFDFYEARVRKMRSPKRNGSAQSWFSLDDLRGQPTSSRHASMVFLSSLRRQLNNVLSPKSIRQFFGVTDAQDTKNSGKRAQMARDTLTANQIDVIITRCDSLVLDKRHEMGLPPIRDRASTYDPSLDKTTRSTYESIHSFSGTRQTTEGVSKPRACSLDTSYSSNTYSDDPSLLCRSQDLSFDRSRGASLDLLSPASASFRTGSRCSGISSLSKLTECSAYTEHSRSDCEKITRRTAEREHNITKLLGVITIMFVISWSVSWSVILIDVLTLVPVKDMLTTNVTLSIARNLFLVNHFCNILVYAVLSKSFREKMSQCYKNCIHCCSF